MREAVQEFLVLNLREYLADCAMKGVSTEGGYFAAQAVEKTFDKLDELYGVKKKPVTHSSR